MLQKPELTVERFFVGVGLGAYEGSIRLHHARKSFVLQILL
jgi:hypothetical protein